MNKNTILSLASNVLKRMEYGLDTFYLLNFENDEIWTGNYTTYLIIDKLNGKNTIDDVINMILEENSEFSYDEMYNATIDILQELINKKFLNEIII